MNANRAEQVAALFPVDGPYSGEATSEAARALAALVRYLNYATAARVGVPDFGPLYDVLGSVRGALDGLDQTLQQVGLRVTGLAEEPGARQDLTSSDRWPAQSTPRDTASAAWMALRLARPPLAQAVDAVRDAQVYVGRLSLNRPED